MKNAILLDLDGVLITTPNWKPDEIHCDGYSVFNKVAVANLNGLLLGLLPSSFKRCGLSSQ